MNARVDLGPEQVVTCARTYLGTPWRHQARLRQVGVDCIGLLVCAFRDAGLDVADVANYPSVPAGDWLIRELEARMRRVRSDHIKPGDVLCFAWGLHPWHVALASGRGTFIHSYRRAERCIEQPLDEHWRRSLHSLWRWPDWE